MLWILYSHVVLKYSMLYMSIDVSIYRYIDLSIYLSIYAYLYMMIIRCERFDYSASRFESPIV